MTLDTGYFRDCYAASADPWGLAERWYEARKYALSLALLPAERYAAAFEPGCSIGILSAQLAARCGRLLACDAVPEAVASARANTAGLAGVQVERRVIPHEWPQQSFDLIVFSELLYYFGDADLNEVLRLGIGTLRPGGHLLAVHWRHPAPDHPRTGDEVHEVLAGRAGLARLARYRDPDFTAEVYTHADGDLRSVAQTGGIA
ncbi:methyltransferase domain-containing protein [Trebonia kvetii]|uniref:Methyltransferase domain-containing protein n=1 Tax=Trebonia kvetii TaxID=2480626 RepID=A0A6P2C292_9ACTN|nr:SAM-dependent methyltransferase [Trebonia kvetii]TVZ04586.1 methyltransferase domain-containing protein [Trebonia kvetii]